MLGGQMRHRYVVLLHRELIDDPITRGNPDERDVRRQLRKEAVVVPRTASEPATESIEQQSRHHDHLDGRRGDSRCISDRLQKSPTMLLHVAVERVDAEPTVRPRPSDCATKLDQQRFKVDFAWHGAERQDQPGQSERMQVRAKTRHNVPTA